MFTEIGKHLQKSPEDTQRLLGIDRDQLQDLIRLCHEEHQRRKLEEEKQKVRLIKKVEVSHRNSHLKNKLS